MEKFFHLKEHGTTVRTEVIAGITTFLTMAYILAVNPAILGTVMDASGVFVATALASAIATFIMAFLANYPIALSAGLGLNAYFAYTVCLGDLKDMAPEDAAAVALTAVFVEGVIFILLSFFKFREQIINGIPANLKNGISAGIGLFVAYIGLRNSNVVTFTHNESDGSFLINLGDFRTAEVVLALVGFLIILALVHFQVKGAVLIGILATWVLGMIAQGIGWYQGTSLFPDFSKGLQLGGITKTAFHFNFGWAATHLIEFITITFSFLYVDLFDTVGTVIGVADKAGLLDKDGNLPRVGKVLMSDAIGTVVGACLGTSTITSFVESSAGVAAGGKTGLSSVVTGALFVLALLLSPVFLAIPSFATTPALLYVGMLMLSSAKKIEFDGDIADTAAAYMAILMMPLSYSIATGIMFAILTWVIIKAIEGKAKDVSPIMWVVFVLFLLRILALVTSNFGLGF